MAVDPCTREDVAPVCRLAPFRVAHADLILSWVRDPREAFWLAPRTPPPLTPAGVIEWQTPGHQGFMLHAADVPLPIGYGELNLLNGARRRYWLGHLIVDPARRGRGYGVALTRLLVGRAFARHAAREVTLVVFPENRAAIACYRAAGLHEDGYETHEFPAYGCRVCLLRMVAPAGGSV